MAVVLRQPRTRQPQHSPRIDWGNPLALGLRGLINGGPGLTGDLVSGQRAWAATPEKRIVTPSGRSIGDSGGAAGVWWDRSSNTATTGPAAFAPSSPVMTAVVVFDGIAHGSSKALFARGFGTSTGWSIYTHFSNGTPVVTLYDGTNRVCYGVSGQIVNGQRNTAALLCDGANLWVWVNGTLASPTAVGGGSITYDASYAQTELGDKITPFGGGAGAAAVLHYGAIWNRVLSQRELLLLHLNPWQLFAPIDRRIWVSGAAPSGPVLSAATVANITSTTATPRVTITF